MPVIAQSTQSTRGVVVQGWRWIMGLTRRARAKEGAGRALLPRDLSVKMLMAGHAAARGGVPAVWKAMVEAAAAEDRHGR
jgi:hypothetical protein